MLNWDDGPTLVRRSSCCSGSCRFVIGYVIEWSILGAATRSLDELQNMTQMLGESDIKQLNMNTGE